MKFVPYRIDAANGLVYGRKGKPFLRLSTFGYVVVTIKHKEFMAHRMIWESVNGPIPEGLQINHINGIKTDNRIENLELVTPSQNTLHAYALRLTSAVGTRNGRAKLADADVISIRDRASKGETFVSISRDFPVSARTISDVVSRRIWSHV